MKRIMLFAEKTRCLRRLACCCALFATASLGFTQAPGDKIPGRYIVQLKNEVAPAKVLKAHGLAPDFVYTAAVKGFAGFIPPGQLKALGLDPDVVSIVPDRVMQAIGNVSATGKPGKPTPTPSQVTPAGVIRIGADPSKSILTGAGAGVAVVDTGLDFKHTDLPVHATKFFSAYQNAPSAQDDNGHGTHVGGIIAAKNNSQDVVGVAPGATLYAVKVLDRNGSGMESSVIAGLNWIAGTIADKTVVPAIRVVNMSLGRPGALNDSPSYRAAVQSLYGAGIAVIVAAGNDSGLEVSQQVPATYPEVLAIASSTANDGTAGGRYAAIKADTASYFTSDGKYAADTGIGVTVSAPGEDQENVSKAGMITSLGILSTKLGGGTTRMSGTSMAAPHVAGVVARYFGSPAATTDIEAVRGLLMLNAQRLAAAPLDSPTRSYSYDQEREGIVLVPEQWTLPKP